MACNMNMNTMLKVGAGILAAAGAAYVVLPGSRELIVSLLPTLIFLLCPLSMLFCMKKMHGQNGQSCGAPTSKAKEKGDRANIETEVKAS
jgi:hypothetical protein